MDTTLVIAVIVAALGAGALIAAFLVAGRRNSGTDTAQAEAAARADARIAALTERLSQMTEAQAAQQAQMAQTLQAQERALAKSVDERMQQLTNRINQTLDKNSHTQKTSLDELKERLVRIDAAQQNITELSTQVVGLQDILSNKQARGAFGEIQLRDLVEAVLPPNAYAFQAPLGDGKRVDCLIDLPNPPGPIGIDAKFPLESWRAMREAENDADRTAAARAFRNDISVHVSAIASKYIVPGETADAALMFLPSEAIYAELHANFGDSVDAAFRAKVFIVSPTTLWATLNTIRAVMKDVRMKEQAGVIQREVMTLLKDVERLDGRVGNLETHFNQAAKDIQQIRISSDKITKRGNRIHDLQLDEEDGTASVEDTLGTRPQLRTVE